MCHRNLSGWHPFGAASCGRLPEEQLPPPACRTESVNRASLLLARAVLCLGREIAAGRLSVVHHGRTRKHCQLYRICENLDNERLVLH